MKNKPKNIVCKPIIANWSLSNYYIAQLNRLIKAMTKNIIQDTAKIYAITINKKNVQIVNTVNTQINILMQNWDNIFNKYAKIQAKQFVENIDLDVQKQLKTSIQSSTNNNLIVKFDASNKKALFAKQATIKDNVNLIKNIPEKAKLQIQNSINEAMQHGRDWNYLEKELKNIGLFTERRAKTIAKDQIFKTTSVVSHARQEELGITKQSWDYTYISKEPRQSHKRANGKIYDIKKGCLIDGEYIFPSQKINCKCGSAPVLEFI